MARNRFFNGPPGRDVGLTVHQWKTCDAANCWDIAGHALKSTREDVIPDALRAKRENKQKGAARLVQDIVVTEPIDPLSLKGKSAEVHTHRLREVGPGTAIPTRSSRSVSSSSGRPSRPGRCRTTPTGCGTSRPGDRNGNQHVVR